MALAVLTKPHFKEAAYTTEDKNTYYKLMQKADQVLKDAQAAVDRIDSEAA